MQKNRRDPAVNDALKRHQWQEHTDDIHSEIRELSRQEEKYEENFQSRRARR